MKRLIIVLFTLVFIQSYSLGQLSPGDLTSAHADLEGISNCTQCHDLGNKPTNAKCLDCHTEIKTRIDQDKGYHSSSDVNNKDCFKCHSEHHGRKFEMIRFDIDEFDHELTQYLLEGEHKVLDCEKCHTKEFIDDPELKKKKTTYLGLDQECLTCHDDYHQGTLSDECIDCHNFDKFDPAKKFDHDNAKFQLKGEHIEVECKECHPIGKKNGEDFQQFTDIKFDECLDCHDNPHAETITAKCTVCHTEKSFSYFIGKKRFNHNTTDFTLKGKHKLIDCFECHDRLKDQPEAIFQDQKGIQENQCIKCHTDEHNGKFGNNCAECHSEKGFKELESMGSLDHSLTDFPLEGKHVDVDCKQCHINSFTEEIDFSSCNNCHDDYHEGEFIKNNVSPDCFECHTVLKGFEETLYGLEQHQESDFPLEGAHVATPCFACHVSEDKWTFKNVGTTCIDCHKDEHNEQFAVDGVTDCEKCHVVEKWFPEKFNHDDTKFPLDGKHKDVACDKCHKPTEDTGLEYVEYKLKQYQCIDCHL